MKKIFFIIIILLYNIIPISAQNSTIINAIDIDYSSAVLIWQEDTNACQYIIQYSVAMGEDSIVVTTQDTILYIDNLISASQYLCKIKKVYCGSDSSDWSNIYSFYTTGYYTDCYDIDNIVVVAMDNQKLVVQWNADTNANYWEIVCDVIGTNPDNTGYRFFTDNMEYVFTNLDPLTTYQIAVRSHCNQSIGNWKYMYVKYLPANNIFDLPVKIDFEDTVSNVAIGFISSHTNPWFIGQAENIDPLIEGHSLYVSNDNGQNCIYNATITSISYVYIDFIVPDSAVSYYVDFSYKANINSNTDGMQIFLLDNGNNIDITSLPATNNRIGDTLYNNTNGIWKQEHIELPVEYISSQRRLLFAWSNTNDNLTNTSIALDNIYITARYCAIPDSLRTNFITDNSAELSWNITNNQNDFNLQYKSITDTAWITMNNIENNYMLNNLHPNTTYIYRVQANCMQEESFYSVIDSFTTHVLVLPPSDISINYQTTFDSAYFTWENQLDALFWIIDYKENTYYADWHTDTAWNNYFNIGNLLSNTQYLFRIRTVNYNNDISDYSSNIPFQTLCAVITQYPYTNPSIIDYNYQVGFVNLPSCFDTLSNTLITPVFNFENIQVPLISFDLYSNTITNIHISTDGGQTYSYLTTIQPNSNQTLQQDNNSIVLNNYILEENIRFKFIFIPINDFTTIAKLSNIKIDYACNAPISINIDTIANTFVSLSWLDSPVSDSWKIILYNENNESIKQMNSSTNSCTFALLDSLTTYYAVIKSVCNNNESFDSSIVYFTTLGNISSDCNIPTNVTSQWFEENNEYTILTTWQDNGQTNIWEVYYKDRFAYDWQTKIITINPAFSIRNLDKYAQYVIKVRAVCSPTDTSDFSPNDTIIINTNDIVSTNQNYFSINLYPNPSEDIIYIDNQNYQITNAMLINNEANVIKSWEILPSQINIGNLPKGNYILIGYIDKNRFSKKVIKQ